MSLRSFIPLPILAILILMMVCLGLSKILSDKKAQQPPKVVEPQQVSTYKRPVQPSSTRVMQNQNTVARRPVTAPAAPASERLIQQAEGQQKQIEQLEKYLLDHPGYYNWDMHNELRHLYSVSNPKKSMEHADIILKNSLMDGYILSILSGWQLDKNTDLAIQNFLAKTQIYSDLPFLKAACLISIGDLYAKTNRSTQAEDYYTQVANDPSEVIMEYKLTARNRLTQLKSNSEGLLEKSSQDQDSQQNITTRPNGFQQSGYQKSK